MTSIDQQFIEYIVKSLVGKPDAVQVDRRVDDLGVLLELTVDPEDLGRVIGKRGATAQSLRTLLRALGTKNDARYNLKIIDNGAPRPGRDDNASSSDDNSTSDDNQSQPNDTTEELETQSEDTSAETATEEPEEDTESERSSNDRYSRTRQELSDLDDLDI